MKDDKSTDRQVASGSEKAASFARREEDERRRHKKGGNSGSRKVDYSKPAVLEYFGGGVPGELGPDLLSERLLSLLRRHAAPGMNEFGALIDFHTAEILQMIEGKRDRITFDQDLMDSVESLVVVHTHYDECLFSEVDWSSFVLQDNADIDMLVTAQATHALIKNQNYDPSVLPNSEFRSVLTLWTHLNNRYFETTADRVEAARLTNLELAKLYGVDLITVPHKEA